MGDEENKEQESCYRRMQIKVQSFIKNSSRNLSKVVTKHPKRTILVYFIVLLIAATGFLRLEGAKNNNIADLFTPGNSESHTESALYKEYFKGSDDSFQIIAIPTTSKKVFDTNAWLELLEFEKKLINIRVEDHAYEDFCNTLMDGSCLHFSPFMYFDYNAETIKMTADKVSTICNHELNYIPFFYVFGSTGDVNTTICEDSNDGLSKATALSIIYGMSYTNYNKTVPEEWLDKAKELIEEYQDSSNYWDIYYYSSSGMSDEVNRGTNGTIKKLGISILMVVIMLVFAFHEDSYSVSTLLAIEAMASVLLAFAMGLGFSLLVGLPWTTITAVIAFLAIGLGVDNIVLLTILFYREDPRKPLEKRLMRASGEAALFNTMSTLTTVLAFLMGVNSSFKGIRTFCLTSAIVMTCVFFSTFTLFQALLTINMRSYEAKKAALREQEKAQGKKHHHHRRRKVKDGEENDPITRFYREIVAKLFLSKTCRVVILVLFAVLIVFNVYKITTIQQGIVPEDAVPEDSYVTAYLNAAREHFQEKIAELNVVFYNTSIVRSTRREIIQSLITDMKTVPYILSSYENPWDTFDKYLEDKDINPDMASGLQFYIYLLQCIQSNPRIAEHLSIDTTNYQIPASKVKFSIDPEAVSNMELGELTMLGTRDVISKYESKYGVYIKAKAYSSMFPYYEMVGITFGETITNLITSAIAVMIVLFMLLPPGPSVIAIINVLLADVAILGWVPITGLNLNAITSTCMVMSVGIAVDFSAHITHAFVETDSEITNGAQRAAMTVTRMGRSLTTSGFTTFLSVLMLSIVNVPSNRMFFTMMSGVVLYGMLFGLLLLPTILAFFNPHYVKPVEVNTPMTPLPPGEEAARLEKTRSRGLKRHHRKHHKEESKEETKEESKEETKEEPKEELKEEKKEEIKKEKDESKKEFKEIEMVELEKEKDPILPSSEETSPVVEPEPKKEEKSKEEEKKEEEKNPEEEKKEEPKENPQIFTPPSEPSSVSTTPNESL